MASLWSNSPLHGIRVVELAGLAPGPFAGMLLADFGAQVLRVDRARVSPSSPAPSADTLARHKSSVVLDLKLPGARAVLQALLRSADVLIDPFRPGVLEALDLAPAKLLAANPRLIVARLTGFRRDGKYSAMAGHDINYLAVSGVLSQLGRAAQPPSFPANLLADFAGGGLMCAFGIVTALLSRERTGKGQIVEANMVDGAAYLGTFLRYGRKTPALGGPRGTNLLDGGCPWYEVYECKDGGSMAVGALEPQFFKQLIKGLGLHSSWNEERWDRSQWPKLKELFTKTFKSRTRTEWEKVFDGKDGCCTPVLSQAELEAASYEQRPAVGLKSTPSKPIDQRQAYNGTVLAPGGQGGLEVVNEWLNWEEGKQYNVENGGLVKVAHAKL